MELYKHTKELLPLLKCILKLSERSKKVIIADAKRDLILSIVEICKNIINGSFSISSSEKFQLRKYLKRIVRLSKREKVTKNLQEEKKLINYRGNIGFLSIIIAIALENAGNFDRGELLADNPCTCRELKAFEDQIQSQSSEVLLEHSR